MSIISLSTFVTWDPAKLKEVPNPYPLQNAPLPDALRQPEKGLVAFYGFHKAVAEIAHYTKEARLKKHAFYGVKINVEVGEIERQHVSWEALPKVEFINLDRITADLAVRVKNYCVKYLAESGKSKTYIDKLEWKYFGFLSKHPELLYQLWKERPFRHLKFIVFPIRSIQGERYYRAMLFRLEAVTDIRGYREAAEPAGLSQCATLSHGCASRRMHGG